MKIRNAIIITDAASKLEMTIAELPDFTGNLIFSRDQLPGDLATSLDREAAIKSAVHPDTA
jgi:hypothetical protein